jgi:hypothetical protein
VLAAMRLSAGEEREKRGRREGEGEEGVEGYGE